jgi:hypothetical protein
MILRPEAFHCGNPSWVAEQPLRQSLLDQIFGENNFQLSGFLPS